MSPPMSVVFSLRIASLFITHLLHKLEVLIEE